MTGPATSRWLRGTEVLQDSLVQELLRARVVAVLATLDPRYALHAVPLWFAAEDDAIVFATGSRSRKVLDLELDARGVVVIHDSRPGFEVCGASIRGRVEIVRGAAAQSLIATVHRRYVEEWAETHRAVREFLSSDDVALRLRPDSAWTWDERGSTANTELRALGGAVPLESTEPRS